MADAVSSEAGRRGKTVSASQYLSLTERSESFSSGSRLLDEHLGGPGLQRGKVLEICGPPGSGKTALGLQFVVSALRSGVKSCWIDTSTRISTGRLSQLLEQDAENMRNIQTRYTPSLAHLYAILKQKLSTNLLPNHGELLIIDDISTIISREFSFVKDDGAVASTSANIAHYAKEKLADKKQRIVGELASTLSKLAGIFNTTIIIMTRLTSQAPYGGGRLVLYPSTLDMFRFWTSLFHHRMLLVQNDHQDDNIASRMASPESSRTVLCLARGANFLLNEISRSSIIFEAQLQIRKNSITDVNQNPWGNNVAESAAPFLSPTNSDTSFAEENLGNVVGSQRSTTTVETPQVQRAEWGDRKRRKIDNNNESTHDDQSDTTSYIANHRSGLMPEKVIGDGTIINANDSETLMKRQSEDTMRIPKNTIPDSDNEYEDDEEEAEDEF